MDSAGIETRPTGHERLSTSIALTLPSLILRDKPPEGEGKEGGLPMPPELVIKSARIYLVTAKIRRRIRYYVYITIST